MSRSAAHHQQRTTGLHKQREKKNKRDNVVAVGDIWNEMFIIAVCARARSLHWLAPVFTRDKSQPQQQHESSSHDCFHLPPLFIGDSPFILFSFSSSSLLSLPYYPPSLSAMLLIEKRVLFQSSALMSFLHPPRSVYVHIVSTVPEGIAQVDIRSSGIFFDLTADHAAVGRREHHHAIHPYNF